VDAWLAHARDALAAELRVDPAELELSDAEAGELLDLARIAAHVSGDRTNAPLLCYLVGRAEAQGTRTVEQLARAVRSTS
jgi:Domain of unknown function (DUF6457)